MWAFWCVYARHWASGAVYPAVRVVCIHTQNSQRLMGNAALRAFPQCPVLCVQRPSWPHSSQRCLLHFLICHLPFFPCRSDLHATGIHDLFWMFTFCLTRKCSFVCSVLRDWSRFYAGWKKGNQPGLWMWKNNARAFTSSPLPSTTQPVPAGNIPPMNLWLRRHIPNPTHLSDLERQYCRLSLRPAFKNRIKIAKSSPPLLFSSTSNGLKNLHLIRDILSQTRPC